MPGTSPPSDQRTSRSNAAASAARMMNRFRTVVTTVIGPGTKLVSIEREQRRGDQRGAEPDPSLHPRAERHRRRRAPACAGLTALDCEPHGERRRRDGAYRVLALRHRYRARPAGRSGSVLRQRRCSSRRSSASSRSIGARIEALVGRGQRGRAVRRTHPAPARLLPVGHATRRHGHVAVARLHRRADGRLPARTGASAMPLAIVLALDPRDRRFDGPERADPEEPRHRASRGISVVLARPVLYFAAAFRPADPVGEQHRQRDRPPVRHRAARGARRSASARRVRAARSGRRARRAPSMPTRSTCSTRTLRFNDKTAADALVPRVAGEVHDPRRDDPRARRAVGVDGLQPVSRCAAPTSTTSSASCT